MAAADSVTARIGYRIVRIVPATRNTARAIPIAKPPPYQIREERAMRRACRLACFHVVLVDPQNLARNGLDLAEPAVQARIAACRRSRAGLCSSARCGRRTRRLAGGTWSLECRQLIGQLSFPGQGDIVLLAWSRAASYSLPVGLVLLAGFLFPAGQARTGTRSRCVPGPHSGRACRSRCRSSRAESHRCGCRDGRSEWSRFRPARPAGRTEEPLPQ